MQLHVHGSSITETRLLVFAKVDGWAIAGRFAFTSPNCDDRLINIGVYVKAVVTRLLHGKCLVRCVHLVLFVIVEAADVQVQRSLVKLQLHRVFRNVCESQAGFRTYANESAAHADLGARIFVGPDIIGIGQRSVEFPRHPIARSLWLDRN
jgi:hypothetical protein